MLIADQNETCNCTFLTTKGEKANMRLLCLDHFQLNLNDLDNLSLICLISQLNWLNLAHLSI